MFNIRNKSLFLLTIFILIHQSFSSEDIYKEELYIRPLSTGQTYFNLLFTTTSSVDLLQSNLIHNYHLFPKTIADIVRSNGVSEFHLSLTQGLWRYDRWGMPIVDAPPGAEIWTWFNPNEKDSNQPTVSSRWTSFVHELGGIICASLNFVDSNVSSTSPHFSFRPQSSLPVSNNSYQDDSLLRYAVLPREIVCTENLTPWKKLLPCNGAGANRKGFIGLLDNAPKLYHSAYHSLRMDLRKICANKECTTTQLELSMSLGLVVDSFNSKAYHHDWTLKSVFGAQISSTCPLSSLTNVYVDLQLSQSHAFNISPEPDFSMKIGSSPIIVYELNKEKRRSNLFQLICSSKPQSNPSTNDETNLSTKTPIVIHRYSTGYGFRDGSIKTVIKLLDKTQMNLVYFEQIPWHFRLFIHTLKITTLEDQHKEIKPIYLSYKPGRDRERPYQLELVIQTNQSILISIDFEMAFLKWNEFPPDPNHGFYIPSAVISTEISPSSRSNFILRSLKSFSLNQSLSFSSSDGFVRLYSESLLVNLPTPDFSMPFNVICLGCTAVALAFGGLHNLTTKQFQYGPKTANRSSFKQRIQEARIRVLGIGRSLGQRFFGRRHEHSE